MDARTQEFARIAGPGSSYVLARRIQFHPADELPDGFDVFVEYGDGGHGQWDAKDAADAQRIAAIAVGVLNESHPDPGDAIAWRIA